MGTPFPNPQDGAATKKKQEQGSSRRKPRATFTKRHQDILAIPPVQVATKSQYVNLDLNSLSTPGPSGIKQCYRSVKAIRSIPLLPRVPAEGPVAAGGAGRAGAKQGKKHWCRHCNKRFSSPGKLAQHNLAHTGELPFGCQHCDKKFNSKFKLVRHGLIHSATRPFSCLICHKTFHRKDHLSNHERIHNPVKNVYICPKENCKKQYTSLLSFKKHSALHSAEEGNLECKICSKTFESQEEIVYHLKVHAGSRTIKNENDKKFECSVCKRKFFTGKDVRRHSVVHTGQRDFHCRFCNQDFGRKDHLVRHVKKAHPNEPWQSLTPGPTVESPEPTVPTASKKGKGEAKKSKTKAELKFSRTVIDDPSPTLKSEQPANVMDSGGIFHFDNTQGSMLLSQQPIFLHSEGLVQIKPEPMTENIEFEEIYDSMPLAPKDIRPLMMPEVDARPSTSLGKYEEYSGVFAPHYIHDIQMMPTVMSDQPVDESMIIQEPQSDHPPYSMEMLKPEIPPQIQQTVLPTFNIAFHNATPSPKAPQHPPE